MSAPGRPPVQPESRAHRLVNGACDVVGYGLGLVAVAVVVIPWFVGAAAIAEAVRGWWR